MAVTAYKAARNGVNDASVGTVAVTTPDNVEADDNAYAYWDMLNSGSVGQRLLAMDFGFTASDLPVGCTIDGWEDEFILSKTNSIVISNRRFQCVKAGAVVGAAKVDQTDFPAVETAYVKGGATDKWGTTMSRAEALAADTGASLYVDIDAGPPGPLDPEFNEHRVERVRRRYYYTEAPAASTKRTAQKGCSK